MIKRKPWNCVVAPRRQTWKEKERKKGPKKAKSHFNEMNSTASLPVFSSTCAWFPKYNLKRGGWPPTQAWIHFSFLNRSLDFIQWHDANLTNTNSGKNLSSRPNPDITREIADRLLHFFEPQLTYLWNGVSWYLPYRDTGEIKGDDVRKVTHLAGHYCIEIDVFFDKIANLTVCFKVIYKNFPHC